MSYLLLLFVDCILPHVPLLFSSEFNSENKLNSTASRVPTKDVVREDDDEEEFLEELSDNYDDDNELNTWRTRG